MPVSIEAPEGWGPTRLLIAELQCLGYHVEEWRVLGRSVLVPLEYSIEWLACAVASRFDVVMVG